MGVGMPLVAMLGEERVDATKHTAESWKAVQAASKRNELTMPLCGVRAVAKARGTDTRFFAHYTVQGCDVDHGEETRQHLAMKEALAKAIDAVPGWHAIIEHPHPSRKWIVDVLAESETTVQRRVAFEVQLSSQTPERYFERSEAYFAGGIFPVWVIPRALEWNPVQVPNIVTGFGKSSPVPAAPADLLRLEGIHNDVADIDEDVRLGRFVGRLLAKGPSWSRGTPSEQHAQWLAEARRRRALEEAEEARRAAFEARIEAMNRACASPEAAYGRHVVPLEGDAFVFATLAGCWKCSKPMLLWWTRTPGWNKRWTAVPTRPALTVELKEKRFENHPKIHRAINAWIRAVGADVPKALIQVRRTAASSTEYSAFTCPSCEAVFGENFLAQIRDEHWSVVAGPVVRREPAPPRDAAPPPSRVPDPRQAASRFASTARRREGPPPQSRPAEPPQATPAQRHLAEHRTWEEIHSPEGVAEARRKFSGTRYLPPEQPGTR